MLYTVTFNSGRTVSGILASSEADAIRAALWLHPSEIVKGVEKCK